MEQEKIDRISIQIKDLIEREVLKKSNDDNKYFNHYNDVMSELEHEINITQEILKDFKESNLNFNIIEQEGYLRALKTMVNRFRNDETYL